jgi:hypothetical protein
MKKLKYNIEVLFPFFLSFIIAMILFSSCVSEKRRAKICSTCPVVTEVITVKDSSSSKTVIKYDTIYKKVVGPTMYMNSPCDFLCDSLGRIKDFNKESTHNGIKQTLTGDSKTNTLTQKCNDDSLMQVNEKITIENNHLRSELEVKTLPPVTTNILTWWQKFMIKCGYAFWIVILGFSGYKGVKYYIKFHLPKL